MPDFTHQLPLSIAVTGAGGFIGSHVVEALLDAGHAVRALVHYNALGRRGHLEEVLRLGEASDAAWHTERRLEIVVGDVQDARCVRELVAGCDAVAHLAALIGIPYSYVAPQAYVNVNVQGTLNVLEACRDGGIERLLHTSTSEVYGSAIYTPICEAHPIQTQSPYAATKLAGDKLAEAYWRSFGVPAVTVRPFNAYGPRQSLRAVIPTVLAQLLDDRCEAVELGSLNTVRDWTYAGDTARGFLLLLSAPADQVVGRVFNLGQGSGMSIGAMVDLARQVTGIVKPVRSSEERKRPVNSEVQELIANASLAAEVAGWRPQVDLATGLGRTAEWLKGHLLSFRPGEYGI